jgi:hypothetical protein
MAINKDFRPPGANCVKGLALRLEHRVADHICMDNGDSARRQRPGHGALPSTDAAGQENTNLAALSHAVTVL